jgi:hypothetical protein
MQGNELLRLDGNLWRDGSHIFTRVIKLCMDNRPHLEYVVLDFLKAHASAGHWRVQGMSFTEPTELSK